MTVLFWAVVLYVFLKCVKWVISPFRRVEEDDYIEPPPNVTNNTYYTTINIENSFNTSQIKRAGGNDHDNKQYEKENSEARSEGTWSSEGDATDYYNIYKKAIEDGRRGKHFR